MLYITTKKRTNIYMDYNNYFSFLSIFRYSFDGNICYVGTINEPPLPRRKKCPELAYKTHEFISCDQQQQPLKNEFNSANRARVS